MGYERHLVTVYLGNRNLPVSPVCIKSVVFDGITNNVDSIVHEVIVVSIRDGDFAQLLVIEEESRSYIFLR